MEKSSVFVDSGFVKTCCELVIDLINEKRSQDGQARILEDQFELLMDRLEKESYFHVQTNGKDYR